jgi:hypothetical protein
VDADFDAITATSYGGIVEGNLLDKSAAETVAGAYLFTGGLTVTTNPIVAGTVAADFAALTATSYGGILEANLLDKSATETVAGAYTFDGGVTFTTGNSVAGTIAADFDALTATSYGGITEANLLDKTASEAITGAWVFHDQNVDLDARGSAASKAFRVYADNAAANRTVANYFNSAGTQILAWQLSTADNLLLRDQVNGNLPFNVHPGAPGTVRIRDGYELQVFDSLDADLIGLSHDGTVGQIRTDAGGGDIAIKPITKITLMDSSIKMLESAAAPADTVAYGQLWVKNTTPCQLWFTDDAGTDTQIV